MPKTSFHMVEETSAGLHPYEDNGGWIPLPCRPPSIIFQNESHFRISMKCAVLESTTMMRDSASWWLLPCE